MSFRLDPERGVSTQRCDRCGAEYRVITGFVFREDDAFAVYKAALHTHAGDNEAWIDVILGRGAKAKRPPTSPLDVA